jgi:hypothetical protein
MITLITTFPWSGIVLGFIILCILGLLDKPKKHKKDENR